MIPDNIQKEHIEKALAEIDQEGIRPGRHSSTYDLVHDGKHYPPKLVLSIANRYANGEELDPSSFSGGENTPAFNKLDDLGYDIVTKGNVEKKGNKSDMDNNSVQVELIDRYKTLIREDHNEKELYKWRLINDFQEKWDIEADNFAEMAQSIEFGNLLDYRSKTLIHFVEDYPEEARSLFKMLYDETIPLKKRVDDFGQEAEELVREHYPDKGSFQDERTIATYLTFRYPDKYTFYKYSFYSDYTNLLEIDRPSAGKRYIHYLELVEEFIDEFISKDEELVELSRNTLTEDCYIDDNLNILAQDILFRVVEKADDIKGTVEDFITILEKIGRNPATNYFQVIDKIVDNFELNEDDQRIVFSTRSDHNRLAFTIGQRYCLIKQASSNLWGFIHPEEQSVAGTFESFDGPPEAYWHETSEFDHVRKELDRIKESCRKELNRTNKSSHIVHSNSSFTQAVFDKSYRNKIFLNAFSQKFEQKLHLAGIKKNTDTKMTRNTILYGPPGTGKTYTLRNIYAQNFIQEEKLKTKKEFEAEAIEELSWWEVIALTLLDAGNLTVPEIKKHRFIQVKENLSDSRSINATIWGQLQTHTSPEYENVKYGSRQEPYLFQKHEDSVWSISRDDCKKKTPYLIEVLHNMNQYESETKKEENFRFTTFHQSFTYEDFVEGIKPKLDTQKSDSESDNIEYTIEKGVFYQAADEACKLAGFMGLQDCLNHSREERSQMFEEADPFALFIDEINRGNISAILGELITLIEDDKRLTADNELIVQLPYSKKSFGVPPNLYIMGTLNTADRSVEALDTALRRRFSFVEVDPDPSLLDGIEVDGVNIKNVLKTINLRIVKLLDRDHKIGHSYFQSLEENPSRELLVRIFKDRVIPLLKEYFFGDFGKIGLVLGPSFIEEIYADQSGVFANFSGYEEVAAEYDERSVYTIAPVDQWNFESIYAPRTDEE